MTLHPLIKIELIIGDQRQDLVAEGVDVAIRLGKLADSTASALSLGQLSLVVAASPSYLEQNGTPLEPGELSPHKAIFAGPMAASEWKFSKGSERVTVKPNGLLSITGSEVGVHACLAGLGIVVASSPSLRSYFASGELVRLLPDWDMVRIESHALFPSGQAAKPAARVFAEYLQHSLKTL